MLNKLFLVAIMLLFQKSASGAHPLVTDDTGTQGAGKFQLELNGEYAKDNSDSTLEIAAVISGGFEENADIVLSCPHQFLRFRDDNDERVTEHGISDIGIELKWRFYERENLSFALKPGISLPSGDDEKGLGDGKASHGLGFITTREFDRVALHYHLGFLKNRTELRDVWHHSLAAEYKASEDLTYVANVGGETNPDSASTTHPLFLLAGFISSRNEAFDIAAGVKFGLSSAETDSTLLVGVAYKFGGRR